MLGALLNTVTTVLHHAEAVDPDLVDRIRHTIDDVTGFAPSTIVLLIVVPVVLFPLLLVTLYLLGPRAHAHPPSTASGTPPGDRRSDDSPVDRAR